MDIKTKGFSMPDGNTHIFIPPAPTETDRGGITAKPRTTEAAEVVVDSGTGKGYIGTDHTLKEKGQAADSEAVGIAISEKADRIISSASGEDVILTDSAEAPLQGLKVFGRSTQDGEPTPENPVPIVSVGDKGNIGISIDGNSQQKLRIETPNGLPGIKVDSGGNYTDSDGQQWICDEIDLERGKYVKRIYKNIFNGNEEWSIYNGALIGNRYSLHFPVLVKMSHLGNIFSMNTNLAIGKLGGTWDTANVYTITNNDSGSDILCSLNGDETLDNFKAFLSQKPMTVITVLQTPIERDLAPEEIAAYKALHTNYPTTVIGNDENAGMEATYVADTKNYIDKKFEKLNQAIVNTQIALL